TCGKNAETADLQDVLIFAARKLAASVAAQPPESRAPAIAPLLEDALFVTVTNVNFDPDAIAGVTRRVIEAAGPAAGVTKDASREELLAWAKDAGVLARQTALGEDVTGLQEL